MAITVSRSNKAQSYHSLTFIIGTDTSYSYINTWDDWGLIPSSRPVVSPPSVRTYYVDVPGKNGQLDLTEGLNGKVTYYDREIEVEFHVVLSKTKSDWLTLYSKILSGIQGKACKIVLDDDPSYYYDGRVAVSDENSNSDGSGTTITISAVVRPYKYSLSSLTAVSL